jgi:hypothetical protein
VLLEEYLKGALAAFIAKAFYVFRNGPAKIIS